MPLRLLITRLCFIIIHVRRTKYVCLYGSVILKFKKIHPLRHLNTKVYRIKNLDNIVRYCWADFGVYYNIIRVENKNRLNNPSYISTVGCRI